MFVLHLLTRRIAEEGAKGSGLLYTHALKELLSNTAAGEFLCCTCLTKPLDRNFPGIEFSG